MRWSMGKRFLRKPLLSEPVPPGWCPRELRTRLLALDFHARVAVAQRIWREQRLRAHTRCRRELSELPRGWGGS